MVISSLSFITNLGPRGHFGTTNSDQTFSIPIADSVVVGFLGRAAYYVNALGIKVQPVRYIYIYTSHLFYTPSVP